ncbi:DoxX family protein [Aestuariivirga sp.]|uniref:DoxX family protein n=1 Tax=Aestuariivirga sp. TaxID=2650926 RepID=UPI0035945914
MNFAIIPASWSGPILSLLRIITGLLFLAHGTAKLIQWPFVEMFKDGVPLGSLFGIGGLIEIVGGILIVIGFFTRPVAFVLSGMMAVAYFMFHAPASIYPIINQGELAILYCFIFLYLAAQGAGPWSVDARRTA